MQLAATGAQDIYLTGNPQMTYFKVVYRRYTNFTIESIKQNIEGNIVMGKNYTITISRNGDLLSNIWLELDLIAKNSGFKNFNSDKFEEARVVLDNGIVKVSGLIALFYNKFNANKINQIGCYRDDESDKDLPFKSGSRMNKMTCAKSAFKKGHTYFALNKKVCRTGMNYGKYGETACNNSNANEVFTLDSEWLPITRLPKGYRPKNHLSFLCVTDSVGEGKPGGTATVNINKNGWVHLLKKINTKSELLSLNNILFFV